MKLTLSTKRAIKIYGIETCIAAYEMSKEEGDSTVSHSIPALKGNRNIANAAINAGRELASKK
jgi:hypothetical protein